MASRPYSGSRRIALARGVRTPVTAVLNASISAAVAWPCSPRALAIAPMIDCQRSDDSAAVGASVDSVEFAPRDLNLHSRLLGSLLNFAQTDRPVSSRFLELARPLSGPALNHDLLFRVELDGVTSL